MSHWFKHLFALFIILSLSTYSSHAQNFYKEGLAQGTTYTLQADLPRWIPTYWATIQLIQRMQNIDQQLSTYRPDSEISKFNHAKKNTPQHISKDFLYVLQFGKILYSLTDGYWDGTIYGLSSTRTKAPGMTNIHISNQTIYKKSDDLKLTLDSIAQGYTVDLLTEKLIHWGGDNIRVELGGEVRVFSQKNHPQKVNIASPYSNYTRSNHHLSLTNQAISTSGFDNKGPHILNPKNTKKHPNLTQTMIVIAPTALIADGLSTALIVLPKNKHKKLLTHFPNTKVVILKN